MGKVLRLKEIEGNDVEGKLIIGYYGYWVLLTYLSVVSAVFGMYFALGKNIGYALVCLMISGICDTLDGRVANLKERTDRQKYYGVQIDALADIVSFGVLPVVIGYASGAYYLEQRFTSLGMVFNILIFCMYILAALIRLAYFNVIEVELQSKNEKRRYYEGLPVTSVSLLIPMVYAICLFFNIEFSQIYTTLLLFISLAFVIKIKIPKPSGRSQFILCTIGIPIIIYIMMHSGM